jgi:putative membrane protein
MGMMGGGGAMGGWIALWLVLGVLVIAAGGALVARALGSRRETGALRPPADSQAVQQARDALRMRYAKGEISREEYLQGKVELED